MGPKTPTTSEEKQSSADEESAFSFINDDESDETAKPEATTGEAKTEEPAVGAGDEVKVGTPTAVDVKVACDVKGGDEVNSGDDVKGEASGGDEVKGDEPPKPPPAVVEKPPRAVQKPKGAYPATGSTAHDIMAQAGSSPTAGRGGKKQSLFGRKPKGVARFMKKPDQPEPASVFDQMLFFAADASARPISAPVWQGPPTDAQLGILTSSPE
jgi:hypothetical protein